LWDFCFMGWLFEMNNNYFLKCFFIKIIFLKIFLILVCWNNLKI
jgi:hypothetical protein